MADKMLSKYAQYCDTACWEPHWKAGESRFKPTSLSYCPDLSISGPCTTHLDTLRSTYR